MDKLVGIIGGMGPEASRLFYKMVTEMTDAKRDQDHVNMIIYSDASMPDRTEAILSGNYYQIHDQLLDDVWTLQSAGCKAIGITCNTAHFFADMFESTMEIPLIHMIRETAEQIARTAKREKVAVLATDGTIKTELYQNRLKDVGVEPFVLPNDMQKLVMYQIYDRIKNGQVCNREKWAVLDKFIKDTGCKKAILACTELSVIKEEIGLDDFYIDPMRVLAAEVIRFSGKKLKE